MINISKIIILILFLLGCKNKIVNSDKSNCFNLNFYDKPSNVESECQVLKLFDEICLSENMNGNHHNVFRIRYFLPNDTGYMCTIYFENGCGILKQKKAKSNNFNIVLREREGNGHVLNIRKNVEYISQNKILKNNNFDFINNLIPNFSKYIDSGEIKDFVEILNNGEYKRYECTKQQRDSILVKVSTLK